MVRMTVGKLSLLAAFILTIFHLGCTSPVDPPPTGTPQAPLAVTATAAVDFTQVKTTTAQQLLGITFDSRTSSVGIYNVGGATSGYYDPTDGTVLPNIAPLWNDFPILGTRYPANAVMKDVDWKLTIGPVANRLAQPLFGPSSSPEVMVFGFDEFMGLLAARGMAFNRAQIMVGIYPTALAPDAAQSAADWVEYANAPNDGANIGGGTDWAALRAANGHPAPYGIKIWNIGNEPWNPLEFNFDATPYLAVALPIIDAMLAIDPTLKITLPAVGASTSAWNTGLFASTAIQGKVYGLSAHYFYDDTVVNGTIPLGIARIESVLPTLIQTAATHNLKVIVGDHAHGIPLNAGSSPSGDPDLAMQWIGAVTTLDFLLMVSQIGGIELANFWTYGLPSNVWHPIRVNADGTYTLMPVAALYKTLAPLFYDNSLLVTMTSPAASDGNVYSLRAGAFRSTDGAQASIIVVNRDKLTQHVVEIQNMSGYTLQSAQILTASGQTADSFSSAPTTVSSLGGYTMAALSVLILQFTKP